MARRAPSLQQRMAEQNPRITADARRLAEERRTSDPDQARAKAIRSSQRWRDTRAGVLRSQPLCVLCQAEGRVTAATEVDHVVPLVERFDLAFVRTNLQPLCEPCHDAKSARERAARAAQRSGRPGAST